MSIVGEMMQIGWFLKEGYPWGTWASQQEHYNDYHYYESGDIFNELSDPQDLESPLLYPLKINLFKAITEALAFALWGTWDDDLISFRVKPKERGGKPSEHGKEYAQYTQRLLNDIWRYNDQNVLLASAAMSQMTYGGVYLRTTWDAAAERVRIEALPADMCFPVWDPADVNNLVALVLAYKVNKKAATEVYGLSTTYPGDSILIIEEWTLTTHKMWAGNTNILNVENPYGFIPFEYIPTRRALRGFYGIPPGDAIMGIQDQINMRLADIGDYLNYNAHPIRWIRNYRGDPKKDLPIGPDQLWNLGKSPDPRTQTEVGTLKPQPIPDGTFKHMDSIMSLLQDVAHVPPVAMGRDEGSQRSALTLVVRMWPLVQSVKYARIFWDQGFRRLNSKNLRIISLFGKPSEKVTGHVLSNEWASVAPKDRKELVDEVIRRVDSSLMSPKRALEALGEEDVDAEMERIKAWLDYYKEQGIFVQKSMSQRSVT